MPSQLTQMPNTARSHRVAMPPAIKYLQKCLIVSVVIQYGNTLCKSIPAILLKLYYVNSLHAAKFCGECADAASGRLEYSLIEVFINTAGERK